MVAVSAPGSDPLVPREPVGLLLRDLRCRPDGLATREATRRLVVYGPNELSRRAGRGRWRELVQQLTHPLALLWLAAALAAVAGTVSLAVAIVVVVILNAAFAFAQERQAERGDPRRRAAVDQRPRVGSG